MMGTSGLLIFVWKGKIRAVYNSMDSFADGPYGGTLGEVVCRFLAKLSNDNIGKMVENLNKAEW